MYDHSSNDGEVIESFQVLLVQIFVRLESVLELRVTSSDLCFQFPLVHFFSFAHHEQICTGGPLLIDMVDVKRQPLAPRSLFLHAFAVVLPLCCCFGLAFFALFIHFLHRFKHEHLDQSLQEIAEALR